MDFRYPADVVREIRRAWSKQRRENTAFDKSLGVPSARSRGVPSVPFPSARELRYLLGCVYHATLQVEEGRRVSARLIYLPKSLSEDVRLHHLSTPPLVLHRDLSLTASSLLKLAPALPVHRTAVLVGPALTTGGAATPLEIWGVVHLDSRWQDLIKGRMGRVDLPPDLLTVTAVAPGWLDVSRRGEALLRLRHGDIISSGRSPLYEGELDQFFSCADPDVVADVQAALAAGSVLSSDDTAKWVSSEYRQAIYRILNLMIDAHHGGALLIVPSSPNLVRDLDIPYSFRDQKLRRAIVQGIANAKRSLDLHWPRHGLNFLDRPDLTTDQLRASIDIEKEGARALRELDAAVDFVASLSGIDGAVVLERNLDVVGCGAEITCAKDPAEFLDGAYGSDMRRLPLNLRKHGTRHRSAARFCFENRNAAAFVVSQDGQARAMLRVGDAVVAWSDVTLGRSVI